ncbi:MAG: chemotaxis protein CheW [Lachnospiraceae bacterium]|nr:chemotaxis protein CheW [Lachnospiraceae bacterium]
MADTVYDEFMDEDTQKGKYMSFRLGNEYYGIGINYVNEIIGIQPITEVPKTEDYIRGLINLRGKIIPVIDVRIRFGKEPVPYNDRTCIIVIEVNRFVVGVIVDTIADVVTIEDQNIVPPPKVGKHSKENKYIYGIGKIGEDVKLLIDPEMLLDEEDIEELMEKETQTEEE